MKSLCVHIHASCTQAVTFIATSIPVTFHKFFKKCIFCEFDMYHRPDIRASIYAFLSIILEPWDLSLIHMHNYISNLEMF
jgi:hypothetical protein